MDPEKVQELKNKLGKLGSFETAANAGRKGAGVPPLSVPPTLPNIDLSKLGELAEAKARPNPKLPRLGSLGGAKGGKQAPLAYDLETFRTKYARGGKPTDHDKHNPDHPSLYVCHRTAREVSGPASNTCSRCHNSEPFEIPMPTLKEEDLSVEEAFARMDKNGDGLIKGPEFRGISESGMFHVVPPDTLKRYAIFGMQKELWIELHGDEVSCRLQQVLQFHVVMYPTPLRAV
eukprot:SAG11_NODE_4005_length_2111_cov_1.395626_2_plen_232_part_00